MFAIASRLDTILIVTVDTLARVDLLSGNLDQVVCSARINRHGNLDFTDGIRAALALGPQKCGHLVILSDEFWTGQVCLANEIVTVIADDQLEQTLALEAEFESGLSAFDSRLGYVRVDSSDNQTTWWVTQAASTQLDAAEAILAKLTRKLIGFGSSMIEPPSSDNLESQESTLATVESCIDLARQWQSKFLSEPNHAPLIRPLPTEPSETQQWRTGIAIAFVVFFLCLALHLYGEQRLSKLIVVEARLAQEETQVKAGIEQQESRSRAEQEDRRKRESEQEIQTQRLNELRRVQSEYEVMRRRPLQVLKALAATAFASHWIRRIDWQEKSVVLSGIAMDHGAVLRFVEQVESQLDSSHWGVQPAKISINPSNDLVFFEAMLIPRQRSTQQLAAAKNGVTDAR